MSGFAALQNDFQRAILEGDDGVLAEILDSPRETRENLFDVYRNAYVLRLVEILKNDYGALHAYFGDDAFDAMARAYVAAKPSHHRSARWLGKELAGFLAKADPYADYPVLSELAALETALSDAFDAADAAVLAIGDLAVIDPEAWAGLTFTPQPSAQRFDFRTNASDVWAALKDDAEECPDAEALAEPERLIVWRDDATPMVRAMSAEEAMMWDEASRGVAFGVLCTMVATYDDPDSAAGRAAGYLHGWVTSGMLAGVTIS